MITSITITHISDDPKKNQEIRTLVKSPDKCWRAIDGDITVGLYPREIKFIANLEKLISDSSSYV
jgi:hypothetical protein